MCFRFFTLKNSLLIGLIAFTSTLFFSCSVFASTQQPIATDDLSTGNATNMGGKFTSTPPTANSSQISSISVKIKNNTGISCIVNMRAFYDSINYVSSLNTTTFDGTYKDVTFNFSSAALKENTLTKFYLNYSGIGNAGSCNILTNYTPYFKGTSSTYAYGNIWNSGAETTSTGFPYYLVNGGSTFIEFATTTSSTCNFQNWKVNVLATESSAITANWAVVIGYNSGISGSSLGGYVYSDLAYPLSVSNGLQQLYTEKSGLMVSGTIYYAKAFICDTGKDVIANGVNPATCQPSLSNTNLIYSSPEWSFVVNGWDQCTSTQFSPNENFPAFITSTPNYLEQINDNCAGVSGIVQQSLCKALGFLFYPSQASISQLTSLKNDVANKPPFGYFNIYSAEVGQLSNATSTSSTLDSVTTTQFMYLTSWANLGIFVLIKQVFVYLLWLVFLIYIYKRFRDFSLHG